MSKDSVFGEAYGVYILFLALLSLVLEKCRIAEAFGVFLETIDARSTLAAGLEIMLIARVLELTVVRREGDVRMFLKMEPRRASNVRQECVHARHLWLSGEPSHCF